MIIFQMSIFSLYQYSVYKRVSQISAIYLFLYVFYAILRCISFKIRVNFLIELLRIYKTMVLTSFFDLYQAPSMRISLILHLNFAHIKPQQPNPVILVTILVLTERFIIDLKLKSICCQILCKYLPFPTFQGPYEHGFHGFLGTRQISATGSRNPS